MATYSGFLSLFSFTTPQLSMATHTEIETSSSNPILGSFKTSFFELKSNLSNQQNRSVAVAVAVHPYKLARLVHHNYSLKERWYVVYYAWHLQKGKLVRVRQFDPMNRIKNLQHRLQAGGELVNLINSQLISGKCLGEEKLVVDGSAHDLKKLSITNAIDYYINQKTIDGLRKNTTQRYRIMISLWKKYLEYTHSTMPLKSLDEERAQLFFRWLKEKRGISNKTFNNYRGDLSTFCLWAMKKDRRLFKYNPIEGIEPLRVVTRKHAAFSDAQLGAIKTKCKELGFYDLLVFIQHIYYTMIRPGELVQLKVANVDLKENRIFVPGTISKNRYDEHVPIAPDLLKALHESGTLQKNPDQYLIGAGTQPMNEKQFWKKNKAVLTALKFTDREYTVYSYKHSGAIALYRQTKDILLVQRMMRHRTVQETQTYLRDLGLDVNYHTMLLDTKGAI